MGMSDERQAHISHPPNAWGLLGGTFNPPHWGHVQIAQVALEQARLQKVLWVPAYHPPHRTDEPLLSFTHRLAMVRAAIAPEPRFQVSDIERIFPNKSFAIDMLSQLQGEHPTVTWYWILGLDAFCTLPRWYQSDRLVPQCTWVIAPRPSTPPDPANNLEPKAKILNQIWDQQDQWQARGISLKWHLLEMTPIPISSTQIRQRTRHRQSIDSLVPDAVQTYIQQHHLYG